MKMQIKAQTKVSMKIQIKSADENENRIEEEDITTSVLSIIIQDILRIVS